MNPYKAARLEHNLTQNGLARIASITPSVVSNVEVGLFHTPPISLTQVFEDDSLPDKYLFWVHRQRIENQPLFHYSNIGNGWHPFRLSVNESFRGFCRHLVFQPSILQEFEKFNRNRALLSAALMEVMPSLTPLKLTSLLTLTKH